VTLYDSLRTVANASGEDAVDWDAAASAAKGVTEPGSVELDAEERAGYASDVVAAREGIRDATGLSFDLPATLEVQSRHHWIDANVATFRELLAPVAGATGPLPNVARRVNTATMAGLLAFAARHVLGQFDPLLLAPGEAPGLYFVRPNVVETAELLDVPYPRFRRWIAFHEVVHAAEFGAAPWLAGELEARIEGALEALVAGHVDREAVESLDAAMTAVEGYAEFAMDQAFGGEYADVRATVEARRRARSPVDVVLSRLLGLESKRRQYERGRAFFEALSRDGGTDAPARVWSRVEHLPTQVELDRPDRWLARLDR